MSSTSPALRLDERNSCELPFLESLARLGWTILDLPDKAPASASYRVSFDEVVIKTEFVTGVKAVNPWLDSDQLETLYAEITDLPPGDSVSVNRALWQKLTGGTTVSENRATGEVSPRVYLLDFDSPNHNRFLAVSQFTLRIPGTQTHIRPDITLFVNGLPLILVECKAQRIAAAEAIPEAIDQLNRYAENRGESGEGVPALLAYNAWTVATNRTAAKFGTVSTLIEKHFFRWLDPFPFPLSDLPRGQSNPNDQDRLIWGMLDKTNLMALLRDYTVFVADERGRLLKIVARYQQFRAVKKALSRLQNGTTKRERGGIIWHTQGSGKSLTMLFLVQEMRRLTALGSWKIVFVTDRTDLQEQLEKTALAIGFTLKVADSVAKSKTLLASNASDLVMVMSQKFQDSDLQDAFPILNTSDKVLILIDEAHRTQYGTLAMCMNTALPNAAQIAYTGTPIDNTERTFGDYIDLYTMKESVDEGTTLRIVYEGRTLKAEVANHASADQKFADVFSDYNLGQRLQILGFGSRGAYLEAQPIIEAKARDMVEHYTTHVFPNGYKGQVVASSQEAAYRYKLALETALVAKIAELEADNPANLDIERLRELEVGLIISGSDRNDRPHLKKFDDSAYRKRSIERFKMNFDEKSERDDDDGHETLTGNVGLLVVMNMLLTGFDAPIEQVMYLDRVLRDHGLLQAIARVNRIGGQAKDKGFVVDYVGVGHHLKAALSAYHEREVQEITDSLHDDIQELGELKVAHDAVAAILSENGLSDTDDTDAFFDAFYDEELRNRYILAFRELTKAFNAVMPRAEAMPYWKSYQNLLRVNQLASNHLSDGRLSMRGIPPKLRAIADEFLVASGVTQKIQPLGILSDDFDAQIKGYTRSKTKAAAIEHAVRNYLDVNWEEDPTLFDSFSKKLEAILSQHKDNWDVIWKALEDLREQIKNREREENFGLDSKRQMPLYREVLKTLYEETQPSEAQQGALVQLTQGVSETLERETQLPGFWDSKPAQAKLRREILDVLTSEDNYKAFGKALFEAREALASRFLEWARSNRCTLGAM